MNCVKTLSPNGLNNLFSSEDKPCLKNSKNITGAARFNPTNFWCNSHQTFSDTLSGHCRAKKGILLPCMIVDLTGIAVIEEV